MLIATVVLSLAAAPALAQHAGMMKAEGTVVMVTPDTLHLDVNGTITTLDLDPQSMLDPAITRGDYVTVWYRESAEPGKVLVTHSERRTPAGTMPAEAHGKTLKTVQGTLVLITPAALEVDVNGEVRTFKRDPNMKIEPGLVQGDTVSVRYREEDISPVEVRLVTRGSHGVGTMPAKPSDGAMIESAPPKSHTNQQGVEDVQRPGPDAPSPGSWTAVEARADRLPSRLPQTASLQPLVLLLGLLGTTLGGALLALGRVRS